MGTVYSIKVRCDDGSAPGCLGTYEEETTNVRDFDFIGTRMFQQGWWRGYRNRGDKEHPKYEDFKTFDVCPACAERAKAGGGGEQTAGEAPIGGDDGGTTGDGDGASAVR